MKIICFDYDITITNNIALSSAMIECCKLLGYKPIICTLRYPEEADDTLKKFEKDGIPVYYTSRNYKRIYLNNLKIYPEIWIDDSPQYI